MSKNGEIVQEIVRGLNNIISTILKEKGILKPEDFTTNTDASFISSEKNASEKDDEKDGDKNTTVVNNTNSQDTIINVAPNEIIETQETYTVKDGKIEIQGEPSKEKKYSL